MQLKWENKPIKKKNQKTQKRTTKPKTTPSELFCTNSRIPVGKNSVLTVLKAVWKKVSWRWKNDGITWAPTVTATAMRKNERLIEGRSSKNNRCQSLPTSSPFFTRHPERRAKLGREGSHNIEILRPSSARASEWRRVFWTLINHLLNFSMRSFCKRRIIDHRHQKIIKIRELSFHKLTKGRLKLRIGNFT